MTRRLAALPILIAVPACTAAEVETVPYTTEDVAVDGATAQPASDPRLCVAGGNVYVVWTEERADDGAEVRMAIGRGGGATWDAPMTLGSTGVVGGRAEHPSLACFGQSAYVAWEDDRNSEIGEKDIYFTYSDDGGREFQPAVQLDADEHHRWDSLGPRLIAEGAPFGSPDTRLHLCWYDNRDGAYDIYWRSGWNGYNWTGESRIDRDVPGAAYSAHPQIGTDGAGGIFIVWEDSRDGGNDIYFNRSLDDGQSWDDSDRRLDVSDAAGASDAFGVTLAIDRNAMQTGVFVAWHDDVGGGKDVRVARSIDGGNLWDPEPARIDAGGEGAAGSFFPALVADGGRVRVAWYDDRDGGTDIRLRGSDDSGASWNPEVRLDTGVAGSAHSTHPRLALVGDRLVSAWTDHRLSPDWTGDPYPDLYFRASDNAGFQWAEDELRIDDDPQSSAISEDLQMVLQGGIVYFAWVDWRRGTPGVYARRMSVAQ